MAAKTRRDSSCSNRKRLPVALVRLRESLPPKNDPSRANQLPFVLDVGIALLLDLVL